MPKQQPIGIFDSGVGGTSIWKEICALLPAENTIYLADSINAPYGEKSSDEIIQRCRKNTELLMQRGCKTIVVACNTATTNAIETLRAAYSLPFIGIEPAIKPAAFSSKTKVIGVLATKGTLASTLFHRTTNLFAKNIKVVEVIGTGLVEFIERGEINSAALKTHLTAILQPLLQHDIDHLVLGCSHYPYLMGPLRELLPEHVEIIDSGYAVARQTRAILSQNNLLREEKTLGSHMIFTNKKEVCETLANLLKPLSQNTEINFMPF